MPTETEVDSLVLNIEVNDKKDGETASKKLSTLTRVLAKFQNIVKNIDTAAFKKKFSSMASSIKPFVSQLNSAKASLTSLDRILSKIGAKDLSSALGDNSVAEQIVSQGSDEKGEMPSAQSGTPQTIGDDATTTVENLTKKYGDLTKTTINADNVQTQFFERYDGNSRIITKVTSELDKDGKVIAGTTKVLNQSFEDISGGGLASFFRSIKRIGMYRLIRTALKAITQSLKEGIDNITTFDATAKQTMSELTSSITVMKNSVGAIIMPLLELITPLIRGIAKAVGTLANAISYLTAKLKGQSTYLKVNIDYLKEYNKQSNLLSYDEFSSLNNQNDTSGMFTEESVAGSSLGGILDDCTQLGAVLAGIATTLTIIGGAKIIGLITSGALLGAIKKLTLSMLSFSATVSGIAVGIGFLVYGIVSLIQGWGEMNTLAKVLIPIFAVLAAVLVGVAVAHAAAKAGIAAPAMAAITAAAITAGIVLAARTAIATKSYANGGMFDGSGTLYQAGEAGAEIVATGSKGTGVVNVNQFKVAMVEALREYDVARHNDDVGDIVINLDGKEISRAQATNNANALSQKYNIVFKPR